jgi:hypothetical protein
MVALFREDGLAFCEAMSQSHGIAASEGDMRHPARGIVDILTEASRRM